MKSVTSEAPVAGVVECYAAAKVVLSRYGLDGYEEADPRAIGRTVCWGQGHPRRAAPGGAKPISRQQEREWT
jgi:hypothetical protein